MTSEGKLQGMIGRLFCSKVDEIFFSPYDTHKTQLALDQSINKNILMPF